MVKVTFDGPNKIINVLSGVSSLDVSKDLYSEWKRWIQQNDNAKYLKAFKLVGGDPITSETSIPTYYYLTNGWRLKLPEENINLTVVGYLLVDEAAYDPFYPQEGDYCANINNTVALITPPTAQDIWEYSDRSVNGEQAKQLDRTLKRNEFIALKD